MNAKHQKELIEDYEKNLFEYAQSKYVGDLPIVREDEANDDMDFVNIQRGHGLSEKR